MNKNSYMYLSSVNKAMPSISPIPDLHAHYTTHGSSELPTCWGNHPGSHIPVSSASHPDSLPTLRLTDLIQLSSHNNFANREPWMLCCLSSLEGRVSEVKVLLESTPSDSFKAGGSSPAACWWPLMSLALRNSALGLECSSMEEHLPGMYRPWV